MIKKEIIGDTTYHIEGFDSERYIVETVYNYVPKKPLLGIFERSKKIVERIAYVPINVLTVALMFELMSLKPIEDDSDGDDDETITRFNVIDAIEHKHVFKRINDRLAKVDMSDSEYLRFMTTLTPTNHVVKGYVKEGWNYLGAERINSMHRSHFVYRTTLYGGHLQLAIINEIGFEGNDTVSAEVSSCVLPRTFINNLTNTLVNKAIEINENKKENGE